MYGPELFVMTEFDGSCVDSFVERMQSDINHHRSFYWVGSTSYFVQILLNLFLVAENPIPRFFYSTWRFICFRFSTFRFNPSSMETILFAERFTTKLLSSPGVNSLKSILRVVVKTFREIWVLQMSTLSINLALKSLTLFLSFQIKHPNC